MYKRVSSHLHAIFLSVFAADFCNMSYLNHHNEKFQCYNQQYGTSVSLIQLQTSIVSYGFQQTLPLNNSIVIIPLKINTL